MSEDRFLTIGAVAKEFGVTTTTVKRWVWQKILKAAVVTPGGHMRFRNEDIQKFKLANIARHVGQLPEPPGPEDTVEAKIEMFLQNMVTTHSHLVWRPARKKRYDRFYRLRDSAAFDALAAAERDRQAKLDDDTIQKITGLSRKELYDEMLASSVADVAERMETSEARLRQFCSCFRVPMPHEGATSAPKRKRLGR